MPFYEYECSACKFYVEALQKISDAPLKKCPSCRKQTLKRLVSAPAFRLAGGGWYETDFKSDKENKRNLAGAEKEPASTETKSETKADKPAETKPATESKTEKSDSKTSVAVKKPATKSRSKPGAKKK
ncbi:MAG TPA: zinc ribbon domain-containing protein [Steroidobacteraceae bacterium]|nr:zinc ribbon domain-containing protein [Steroidobacteraceae bacterium]